MAEPTLAPIRAPRPPASSPDGAALAAVTLVLALVAAGPALAQERPRLLPARDADVTYRTAGDHPREVHVRFKGGTGMLRYEDRAAAGIVDLAARRVTILEPRMKVTMDLPTSALPVDLDALLASARYTREGADTVAGLRCTVWGVQSSDGRGTGCVTADGLVLRGQGSTPSGARGGIEAVAVSYAPQPDSLFAVPQGYTRLELPSALPRR